MSDIEQKLADLAAGVDQLRVILDATQAWVAASVAVDLKWQVAELLAEVRAWPRNAAEEVSA